MADESVLTASWLDSLAEPSVADPTTPDAPATDPGVTALADLGQRATRYRDLGLLARGGMGQVRRVHDVLLGRPAVMKIMHAPLASRRKSRIRFLAEVRITARLQHPGIVPVQEAGELPDGRLWFTMKEVAGRTLGAIADELHRAMDYGADATADGWNLRRLVDALWRVSQTLAYAHGEGVIHRDIKPDNLMVGAFGEVMVMDWGIAYDLRHPTEPGIAPETADDRTGVVGTVSYMAPEQALGQPPTPATDVFALGGVLYHLLTGRKPRDARRGVRGVMESVPAPVADVVPDHLDPPAALVRLCEEALNFDPARRPRDAGRFGAELGAWLDGEARRAEATALIERARQMMPRRGALRARAESLDRDAERRLAPVPPHAPIERKRPGWQMQDEAEELRRRARRISLAVAQTLRQALEADPDAREARELLTVHYRELVLDAESRGDHEAADAAAEQLRLHDEAGNVEWLRGDGALSLTTDPPGAVATLYRLVEEDRRRVPERTRRLPDTPVLDAPLPQGSHLVTLQAPGRADVLYPVHIPRGHHWNGVAPGAVHGHPIYLPRADELADDDIYIPAGWCRVGGDPDALDPLPAARRWVDGFVIKRHPVAHREYLAFLESLVRGGRVDEAERWAPEGRSGEPLYSRRADGGFELQRAIEIDWTADMPVVRVPWTAARAYTAWLASETGQPWRLPDELEWEKAARGVDGRPHPMGDYLDPSWACTLPSHTGRPAPPRIGEFDGDCSPYGVRWMAGGVQNYCETPYRRFGTTETDDTPADDRFRIVRGGTFVSRPHACRAASRYAARPEVPMPSVGIRPVRSLPGERARAQI